MKRLFLGLFLSAGLLLNGFGWADAEDQKAEAIRAKQGRGPSAGPSKADIQRVFERLGKLDGARRARGVAKVGTASNLTAWAKSDRSLQVLERPEGRVYTHLKRGVVAVEPYSGQRSLTTCAAGEKPKDAALRYVAENYSVFGLKSPRTELALERSEKDVLGMTHLFYRQQHEGIPFWGRQLAAHLDASGALTYINCLVEPTREGLSVEPGITEEEAIAISKTRLEAEGNPVTLTEEDAERFGFDPPRPRLYYWQKAPMSRVDLVWMVEIRPNIQDWMRFFIDALTGEVLDSYNATNFADGPATAQAETLNNETVTLQTYQIGTRYYLIDTSRPMYVAGQTGDQLKNDPKGVVWTLDLRNQDLNNQAQFYYVLSENNTWTDASAVSAHYYTGLVYNYYKNLPNILRNSFDNQGKTMMTLVRVGRNGQAMDNAFWNGSFVSLGDGKQITKSWAGALDFVAHEFTHAHVQYTANLEYKFQSGALNETYADIGGVALDNEDFLLGEDIVVAQYFPSGAMRDMGNPHNGGSGPNDYYWQPAHMNEYQNMTQDQDHGGVHVNNGITNLAAYKIMTSLGRSDGEQVLFRALVHYLTNQSSFIDFRLAAVKSAGDLFGEGSEKQNKVKQAFDEVGIVQGSGTEPTPDTPVVQGLQYILMVNEYDQTWYVPDNSLLITNGFASVDDLASYNYLNQNYTQVNAGSGRPIAVDPYGQEIIFVDAAYNVRSVSPDGTGEQVILDTGDWWSVAISPSGTRVAMTRSVEEKIIWLFDLQASNLKQLTLLHPTTDHSNEYADVVNFADSLVFLDDQLLAYDCYNSVQSPGTGTLSFWAVNVVDVVSGQIYAILPPQRPGVNVVNPIFASTNKTILGVEVFERGVKNEIYGINLSTGAASVIVNNGLELGYPCYSVDDAFMLYCRPNVYGYNDIRYVALAESKIAADPSDPGGVVFGYTQLPMWFAQGTPPSASVGFSAVASSGSEGVTTVNIPVTLSQASSDTITVDYAVTGGNAIGSGVDYTLESGRLTFAPQSTTRNIVLTVVDDAIVENDESITIALSRPVNAWMGEISTHTYTILDNDLAAPTETPTATVTSTATWTMQPPTVTATSTPTVTWTPTSTATGVPPTGTFTPTATVTPTQGGFPGDLDGDGGVNPLDAFQLFSAWMGKASPQEGDVDGDGKTDYKDLFLMSVNWMKNTSAATPPPTLSAPTSTPTATGGTVIGERESNDTANTAQALGTLQAGSGFQVSGRVSSGGFNGADYTGDLDYYSFQLPSIARISFECNWPGDSDLDAGLAIQDAWIAYATGSEKPIVFQGPLSEGDFVLLVASKNQSADYQFSLSASAFTPEYSNDASLLNGKYQGATSDPVFQQWFQFNGSGGYEYWNWSFPSGNIMLHSGTYRIWYPYLILDRAGEDRVDVYDLQLTLSGPGPASSVTLDGRIWQKV